MLILYEIALSPFVQKVKIGLREKKVNFEARLALHHLVPGATQGVVGQELDHVAGREELVAYGELTAVARGVAFSTHFLPLILAIEVLVDPADGFVFGPYVGKFRLPEDIEHGRQGTSAWPQQCGRITTIEQHPDLDCQFIAKAFQVESVPAIG